MSCNNTKRHLTILILIISLFGLIHCKLDIIANKIDGTENLKFTLTDKQLSIQKYLVWLTCLQEHDYLTASNTTKFGWLDWESNYNNDQTNMDSVRYPLAFIGYAAASLAYTTPAYRHLTTRILDNVIQRLLEQHQYAYIELYWSLTRTFPDPVTHENIMYSGHLAMLIALYESISGDLVKYSEIGWKFVWNNNGSNGTSIIIEYNAAKLMEAINRQVVGDETGGVSCEPNSIFVVCNNHHRIAFALYDAMHGTNFSRTNSKWEKWVKRHGRAPENLPIDDYRYFRIIYYRPIHEWIPIYGTAGNDAWTLAFMNGWIGDKEFAREGFERLLRSTRWRKVAEDEEYLETGMFGRISELNTWLASSFYPAVESQYYSTTSGGLVRNKTRNVYTWFERNFGTFSTRLINNCNNTYLYRVSDDRFRIHTVANLLLSMVTDNETFIQMYSRPFYARHRGEPELAAIDYPQLHVKYAEFTTGSLLLRFGLKTDCSMDVLGTSFEVRNVVNGFVKAELSINGQIWDLADYARFDSRNKVIYFTRINVSSDYLNEFQVYF